MNSNKPIGGYLTLEVTYLNGHYHQEAIKLNTARNAFEYVLRANSFSKVYLPYYSCDVLFEPLKKLNVAYEFYNIDYNLEPIFDFRTIKKGEVFLYINYFGLKDKFAYFLSTITQNLILDNSQAFFAIPSSDILASFYSARKFFGVSDGAYLYTNSILNDSFGQDISCERMSHLLKRIEYDAETGYADFAANENSLVNQPIKRMSVLTDKILSSIPYNQIARTRNTNYRSLNSVLNDYNKLKTINNPKAPLCYPFLIENGSVLKDDLIRNKIFIPTYWKSVLDLVPKESIEYDIANNLIPLPIDQRYDMNEMQIIINLIMKHKNSTK